MYSIFQEMATHSCRHFCCMLLIYTVGKEVQHMGTIKRSNLNQAFAEECAYSEIVEAGDFAFLGFCVGNIGQSIEMQVHGALNDMERRLQSIGLTLQHVVKLDVLLRDPWNIPSMEKVFKERFKGAYPARKTIASELAHQGGENGLQVQIDAIAYRG